MSTFAINMIPSTIVLILNQNTFIFNNIIIIMLATFVVVERDELHPFPLHFLSREVSSPLYFSVDKKLRYTLSALHSLTTNCAIHCRRKGWLSPL